MVPVNLAEFERARLAAIGACHYRREAKGRPTWSAPARVARTMERIVRSCACGAFIDACEAAKRDLEATR